MFSPEMMKAAQNMMANMSPEQMAQMSQMAGNMDPAAMQRMQQQMGQGGGMPGMPPGGMPDPEQMRKAQEDMKNMSPEEMQRKMAQAQQQMSAQQNYYAQAALRLKNEGNQCVGKKEFGPAKEKYKEGLKVLADNNVTETAVKQACTLNLALCHLKLEEYDECIPLCDEVLSTTGNMKAFYRRGAAKLAKGEVVAAYTDLAQAVEKAGGPADDMIRDEFKKCEKIVEEKNLKDECETALKTEKEASEEKLRKAQESVDAVAPAASSASAPSAASGSASLSNPSASSAPVPPTNTTTPAGMPPMPPGMMNLKPGEQPSPDQMKQGMDMMRDNPELMQQSMKMFENMDPEQLAQMTGRSGAEAAQMKQAMDMMSQNPDMMNQMQDMMKNMDPESMEAMMKLQGKGGKGGGKGGMDPANMSFTDPETIKNMETVVKGMTKDPRNMVNMAKGAGVDIPEGAASEKAIAMFAKCLPWLMACWRYLMYLRQACVWLVMSRNGRLLCALLVLIFAVWQGFIG